jgi:hypothetical protein
MSVGGRVTGREEREEEERGEGRGERGGSGYFLSKWNSIFLKNKMKLVLKCWEKIMLYLKKKLCSSFDFTLLWLEEHTRDRFNHSCVER